MGKNLPKGAHPCKQCAQLRNFKKDIRLLENNLIEKFGVCNYEFLTNNFSGLYSKKKIEVRCKKCNNTFFVNP